MNALLQACGVVFLAIITAMVIIMIVTKFEDAWRKIANYRQAKDLQKEVDELRLEVYQKDKFIDELRDSMTKARDLIDHEDS